MATFDEKPWWRHERKPAQVRTLVAVQPEPARPRSAITWNERLAERERRLSQGSTPPRGWPPAAA